MQEEIKYYSVSQYNKAIQNFLDSKEECQNVHIKGEISNFKGHTRGHLYFTLKDEESRINAVMFSSAADKLDFVPKDGDEVNVDGRISVYVPNGGYQVYVNRMMLAGNGDLLKKFEELKKKLSDEGLFDVAHKKPIPKYPTKIGIVTAPTGAAIRDILSTIKRRYPIVDTILFPSLVQGDEAKFDVVRQIEKAQEYDLDLLIVGRGGGSIEDLWAFNEEMVARAIYNSKIPIISAVGHEPDVTIADYVADLRAPTPTGAAEMAVPNMADLFNLIKQMQIRANQGVSNKIDSYQQQLDALARARVLSNPLASFEIKEQKLDTLIDRLNAVTTHKLDICKNNFNNLKNNRILVNPEDIFIKYNNKMELMINKLDLLNPLNVIAKGYSVALKDNKAVKSIKEVNNGDEINLRVNDGIIFTNVKGVEKNGN